MVYYANLAFYVWNLFLNKTEDESTDKVSFIRAWAQSKMNKKGILICLTERIWKWKRLHIHYNTQSRDFASINACIAISSFCKVAESQRVSRSKKFLFPNSTVGSWMWSDEDKRQTDRDRGQDLALTHFSAAKVPAGCRLWHRSLRLCLRKTNINREVLL